MAGILQKIGQYFKGAKSASSSLPLNARFIPQFLKDGVFVYSYNERNLREFTFHGYGRNPYVFMVVDHINDVQSTLPRTLVNSNGEEVQEQELEALLMDPSPGQSKDEFLYRVGTELLVNGNAIIYGLRPIGMGRYGELHVAITSL